MKTTIEIPLPLSGEYQREVVKNIYWIDPDIEKVSYRDGSENLLEIEYAGESLPEATKCEVQKTAENIIRSIERVQMRTVYEQTGSGAASSADPMPELLEKGWVRPMFNGGYSYRGLFLELMRGLDRYFCDHAISFGAHEYRFPTTLDFNAAKKCGYLENYPQNVNLVSHIHEDIETIRKFKENCGAASQNDNGADMHACTDRPDTILSPNVCYHFWHSLDNVRLKKDSLTVGTAGGICHRYEGQAMEGIERLREFYMRELFAIGSYEDVVAMRDRMLESQVEFMKRFEIAGKIETASDPFFVDSYSEKRVFQLGLELKYEMRADLPFKDSSLSVSSVNFHNDYFAKTFNITTERGEGLNSCCLAYGLDRWCLAVFAQYGLEDSRWPEALREVVRGK